MNPTFCTSRAAGEGRPPFPGLVPRPRLSRLLAEGTNRRLTLISIPAGFGKTTLLREWRMAHLRDEGTVCWVSLDDGDNDPVLFFSYVIAALGAARPGIGEAPLPLLQSPQGPPLGSVLTVLLNELAPIPGTSVLMLDGYHVVENPAIHDAVALISCRSDPPLARKPYDPLYRRAPW